MNAHRQSTVMRSGPLRRVLVGISASQEEAESPALNHAIALARACQAKLSLYVFPPSCGEPMPMSAAAASIWLAEETARLERLTSAASRAGSGAISDAGLDVTAERSGSLLEPRSERFVQLARVHDLAVLDAVDMSDTPQRMVIEDVLFDSGRPLLLVPRHHGISISDRIVVAWDGSARAARAVKDALPLLAQAKTVAVVTIKGEKDLSRMAPGADLATYLACHGIDCKLATLVAEHRDAAERLRLFVAEEDMEMIVMGAFVHSRFRQTLLGGVTQSLLDQPPVPLFMAY